MTAEYRDMRPEDQNLLQNFLELLIELREEQMFCDLCAKEPEMQRKLDRIDILIDQAEEQGVVI